MKKKLREMTDYDHSDTSEWINPKKPLTLKDLGLKLPAPPPTQVVSIRLPTRMLNALRAKASSMDIPYQALIKLALETFTRKIHHPHQG